MHLTCPLLSLATKVLHGYTSQIHDSFALHGRKPPFSLFVSITVRGRPVAIQSVGWATRLRMVYLRYYSFAKSWQVLWHSDLNCSSRRVNGRLGYWESWPSYPKKCVSGKWNVSAIWSLLMRFKFCVTRSAISSSVVNARTPVHCRVGLFL